MNDPQPATRLNAIRDMRTFGTGLLSFPLKHARIPRNP
jgi:hypothetical protein